MNKKKPVRVQFFDIVTNFNEQGSKPIRISKVVIKTMMSKRSFRKQ